MNDLLQLGPLSAKRGHRSNGFVSLELAGESFSLPVILINGSENGPRMAVTAGIHGAEYPCVEAAVRLGRQIEPSELRGQLVIVPSANPLAFAARSIYTTPPDGKNLNRQFPGNPTGSFTEVWADWLFNHVMRGANAYIDLHGGDMIEALVPFVAYELSGDSEVDASAHMMAEAFGIRYALTKDSSGGGPSGTTVSASAQAGVPALLAEAGGQGVMDEASVDILRCGVIRVLKAMGMIGEDTASVLVTRTPEPIQWLDGWSWLRAEVDGLFYPTVGVGDEVVEGRPLGRIADFFGETRQEIFAPASGIVLFLVTSLAMNEGDPLLAVAY